MCYKCVIFIPEIVGNFLLRLICTILLHLTFFYMYIDLINTEICGSDNHFCNFQSPSMNEVMGQIKQISQIGSCTPIESYLFLIIEHCLLRLICIAYTYLYCIWLFCTLTWSTLFHLFGMQLFPWLCFRRINHLSLKSSSTMYGWGQGINKENYWSDKLMWYKRVTFIPDCWKFSVETRLYHKQSFYCVWLFCTLLTWSTLFGFSGIQLFMAQLQIGNHLTFCSLTWLIHTVWLFRYATFRCLVSGW